MKKTQVDTIV